MNLNDEDIQHFQELYRKRYGKEISKEVAYEQGKKLIRLLDLLQQQKMTPELQQRIDDYELADLDELTRFIVWKMEQEGRSNN